MTLARLQILLFSPLLSLSLPYSWCVIPLTQLFLQLFSRLALNPLPDERLTYSLFKTASSQLQRSSCEFVFRRHARYEALGKA